MDVVILPCICGRIRGGTGYTALHGEPLDCGDLIAGECFCVYTIAPRKKRWPALTRSEFAEKFIA